MCSGVHPVGHNKQYVCYGGNVDSLLKTVHCDLNLLSNATGWWDLWVRDEGAIRVEPSQTALVSLKKRCQRDKHIPSLKQQVGLYQTPNLTSWYWT